MNEHRIAAISIETEILPDLAEVGGKGLSLIKLTRLGMPVPPGFILPVSFFQTWLETIQSSSEWKFLSQNPPNRLKELSDSIKNKCYTFSFNRWQTGVLADALSTLNKGQSQQLFAVRSSAPNEDLAQASFAGCYETTLGVTKGELEAAIVRSFASCFDERVISYQINQKFDLNNTGMAVIIQQQISADTAGVAFSLNPINNCYDEAAISANFGLGESVVSGLVSPDTFVLDKISGEILERKWGKKESTIWLMPQGGVDRQTGSRQEELSVSDENLKQILELLIQIEKAYQTPIDIEWGFSDHKLHIFQARPITSYIPLPVEMQTRPGAPRILYLDVLLAAQGIDRAFSVLGMEYYGLMGREIIKDTLGNESIIGIRDGFLDFIGGRSYMNLSNTLRLPGKKRTLDGLKIIDVLTAQTIKSLDLRSYIPNRLPKQLKGVVLGLIFTVFRMLDFPYKVLKVFLNPVKYHQFLKEQENKLVESLKNEAWETTSLKGFTFKTIKKYTVFGRHVLPALLLVEVARSVIKRPFKKLDDSYQALKPYLEQSIPNNITIEMGLALFRLSQFKEIKQIDSETQFVSSIKDRSFSPEFLKAWDNFQEKYGFRCPIELDIAQSRFAETPEEIYRQLKALSTNTDPIHNPQFVFDHGIKNRNEAFRTILDVMSNRRRLRSFLFRKNYQIFIELAAYREIPKYYAVMILGIFRRQILAIGQTLLDEGRLDRQEQVFDLTIDQLENALADSSIDLRSLSEINNRFLGKIKHIKKFPRFIDSRGKILNAPIKDLLSDDFVGEPISPGLVRGKIKILSHPQEKPVLPGEILVARATDPGWTPLFLNAAGIILEVGGMMQHGALVAREYGKPCIAGIENITSLFNDGDLVEMNGANGLIRIQEKRNKFNT